MSPEQLSVIHLCGADDDSVCRTQQAIDREIASGRDVVVMCEGQRLMREERLRLARPAIARYRLHDSKTSGRVAIVDRGCDAGEKYLPSHIGSAVQFFASMDSAITWLRRATESSLAETSYGFTLPN